MRTQNFLKHLILGALLAGSVDADGQATVVGNSGIATNFLGWNSNPGNNFPLQIRHDGSYPIEFHTSGSYRGQINPKMSYAIGTAPSAPRNGFMLLSGRDNFTQNVKGPFTRLHLVDDVGANNPTTYAQPIGYRQWMRNGITFTGNSDQAYLGQKYSGDDNTDFVIQWSDNPNGSPWGIDRMKFIFSSQYTGAHTGMGSEYGLEAMRLFPASANAVNVGIGDFFAYGGDPTERLHVRDGRVRIQQLPDDPETGQSYKVMVVDDSNNPAERGVVKWKNFNAIGSCSSGWRLQGNNAVTAYDGNTCPPQSPDRVGIGTANPSAKLHIASGVLGVGGSYTSVQVDNLTPSVDENGSDYVGVLAQTADIFWPPIPSPVNFFGGRFVATNATKENIGVEGVAQTTGSFMCPSNVGVRGIAYPSTGGVAYAVQGISSVGGVAGKFSNNGGTALSVDGASVLMGSLHVNGPGWINGGTPIVSDQNFKHNIQPLDGSLDLLMQLHPKRYLYNTEEFAFLGLPQGEQMGLLAQDVEPVLPHVVHSAVFPEMRDTAGVLVHEAVPLKGIDYTALIPVLIGALQEQNARVDALQAQLAACCAANPGMAPGGNGALKAAPATGEVKEQRLLIIPNPVADLTTLEYYVPQAGKVSLSISTSDGKPMGTLREEQAEVGAYTYQWNTTKLASGTYFCTYMLDGAVVVKRAVKVK